MDVSPELRESYKAHARSIDTEDHREMERSVLKLMQRTLDIDHLACRESALHGLGHWKFEHPDEVELIIDNWLEKHKNTISNPLKEYAEAARTGRIL